MDDARPKLAADAAEIVYVVQQRIHERAAAVAGGRVYDHPSRLVDHDDVRVLVKDREWKVFGRRGGGSGIRQVDLKRLSGLDRRAGAQASRGARDVAFLDESLEVGP